MLVTTFATNKQPSSFSSREDFNLKAVYVVIYNCSTAIVLNNKDLFTSNFYRVIGIGIVIVGGGDYHLTYIGNAELS